MAAHRPPHARYRNPKLASQSPSSLKTSRKPPTAKVLLVRLLEHSPPTLVIYNNGWRAETTSP